MKLGSLSSIVLAAAILATPGGRLAAQPADDRAASIARGRYLVVIAGCIRLPHARVSPGRGEGPGARLARGRPARLARSVGNHLRHQSPAAPRRDDGAALGRACPHDDAPPADAVVQPSGDVGRGSRRDAPLRGFTGPGRRGDAGRAPAGGDAGRTLRRSSPTRSADRSRRLAAFSAARRPAGTRRPLAPPRARSPRRPDGRSRSPAAGAGGDGRGACRRTARRRGAGRRS